MYEMLSIKSVKILQGWWSKLRETEDLDPDISYDDELVPYWSSRSSTKHMMRLSIHLYQITSTNTVPIGRSSTHEIESQKPTSWKSGYIRLDYGNEGLVTLFSRVEYHPMPEDKLADIIHMMIPIVWKQDLLQLSEDPYNASLSKFDERLKRFKQSFGADEDSLKNISSTIPETKLGNSNGKRHHNGKKCWANCESTQNGKQNEGKRLIATSLILMTWS